jgi:arylsulfatase A-like enzyme
VQKTTTEFGLHVPLIVIGPAIAVGGISTNIVDLTDFMPTFARIAGIGKLNLQAYGIMDGRSFYNQFSDPNNAGRCGHMVNYLPYPHNPADKRVYVQDTVYKLYDSTNNNYFFNLQKGFTRKVPNPDDQLTANELLIKQKFSKVLAKMHN